MQISVIDLSSLKKIILELRIIASYIGPVCSNSGFMKLLTEDRNGDCHKNSNNSNDNKKFCQRESIVFLFHSFSPPISFNYYCELPKKSTLNE